MPLLQNGDAFPKLVIPAVGGGTINLPDALAGSWGAVVIYRGAWCPFCNAQLAGFAAEKEALDALGLKVIALSVDDEATSAATVAKNHLQFPVGHSANADAVAAATGAYVNANPHFCSRPVSSSARTAQSRKLSTRAARSAAWSPRTSWASSAT